MRRRDVLVVNAGTAVLPAFAVRGQQKQLQLIRYLSSASPDPYALLAARRDQASAGTQNSLGQRPINLPRHRDHLGKRQLKVEHFSAMDLPNDIYWWLDEQDVGKIGAIHSAISPGARYESNSVSVVSY